MSEAMEGVVVFPRLSSWDLLSLSSRPVYGESLTTVLSFIATGFCNVKGAAVLIRRAPKGTLGLTHVDFVPNL